MDGNLVVKVSIKGVAPARELQQASGRDQNSIDADPQFIDPVHGDYRVKDGSPALALGFVNFPMDQFGVQKPELAAIALTPRLPGAGSGPKKTARRDDVATWQGEQVRNIRDEGEMSAYGLPGVTGVLVLAVDPASVPTKAGLRADDVILGFEGKPITQVSDLMAVQLPPHATMNISRNQKRIDPWFLAQTDPDIRVCDFAQDDGGK